MAVTSTHRSMFKLGLVASFIFFAMPHYAEAAPLIRAASNLGLAGYWPMNEGAGTAVGNFVNHADSGAAAGGPTWVSGKIGKALSFDGVNDTVNLPANSTLVSGISTATVSLWVKLNSAPGLSPSIFSYSIDNSGNGGSPTASSRLAIDMNTSRQVICGGRSDDGELFYSVLTNNALDVGVWYLITCTVSFPSDSVQVYFNGALQTTTGTIAFGDSLTDTTPSTNAAIGSSDTGAAGFFPGVIDDVRLYHRVLSTSEITSLARTGGVTRRTVSNAGLIGYWPLDEGGGAQAGDFSGNGNTGGMNISTNWTNGRRGGGWFVQEPSDRISVPDSPSLNPTSQITMTAWIYPQNWSANRRILQKGITDNQYRFTAEAGSFLVDIRPLTGVSTTLPPTNQWTHVAVTYNGSAVAIYYNGVLQTSAARSGSLTTSSDPLIIGCKLATSCAAGDAFNGTLDDVRLYNRALSVEEIQALAQAGQTGGSKTPTNLVSSGLVGYWPFDGRFMNWTTNQALDASGGGNNGALTGFSTTTSAVPGRVGQALEFRTGSIVNASNGSDLNVTGNSLSLSMWLKKNSSTNTGCIIRRGVSATNGYTLEISPGGQGDGCVLNDIKATKFGVIDICLSGFPVNNEWNHMVVTWGSDGARLYINGALQDTDPNSSNFISSTANFIIGNGLEAFFDDVRAYNRTLTAEEVVRLFQAGR